LTPDSPEPERQANPDLFWAGPALGAHELIINAPDPVSSLAQLTVEQVSVAMEVWRQRMRAHPDAACRHLIVNEGVQAGASLAHTHAQLYALDFVPAMIARERERFGAYAARTMGANMLADLVQDEVRRRERIVAIDGEAVLMAPYGARFPFQLMIAPRAPRMRFEDDGPIAAAMLHDALGRLARRLGSSPPLNLWIRTAPSGAEHFCWRIDIIPRLTHIGGLELGAGVNLNIVAPEQAAAELRDI
jgi:UDPglucose--hexose-1-phosphate uridylyltransferase